MKACSLLFYFALSLALVSCGTKNRQTADNDQTSEEVVLDENELEEIADGENEIVMSEEELTGIQVGEGEETYEVQKGDTLMWVAFKLYGDYRMWKKIAEKNSSVLNGKYILSSGMKLVYNPPSSKFEWEPKGEPYLILGGDTLGKISGKVYGTTKKWRYIYKNNQPMIRDPNKIYKGFTLYYLPKNELAMR